MNPVVIVITVVLLIFHTFLVRKFSIFAFSFFSLLALFCLVSFFNFRSGKRFIMTSCQIKTTESFIVRQPPMQSERSYQTTNDYQDVGYTCKKRKAAIFKTQSERTGSGNCELETLKWGTFKMGKL